MRALVLTGPGTFALDDVPIPEPENDQIRVTVHISAVSAGTETLASMKSAPGERRRFGYMIAGTVDAVGSGATLFAPGDRVCGMHPRGHAEYCVGDEMRTVRVPEDVSFLEAACSYWAVPAMRGVHRTALRFYDDAAVIGQGPIGLMATQILNGMARHVIAVDMITARLDKARELGATDVWNPAEPRPAALPQPQAAVVAAGSEGAFRTACELVRPRGRVVFLRMPASTPNLDMEALAYPKDLELVHAGKPGMQPSPHYVHVEAEETLADASQVYPERWYFRRYIEASVDMVRTKRIDVKSVVSTVTPAQEAPQTMERLVAEPERFLGVAFEWS